jgi:hypothetical protein
MFLKSRYDCFYWWETRRFTLGFGLPLWSAARYLDLFVLAILFSFVSTPSFGSGRIKVVFKVSGEIRWLATTVVVLLLILMSLWSCILIEDSPFLLILTPFTLVYSTLSPYLSLSYFSTVSSYSSLRDTLGFSVYSFLKLDCEISYTFLSATFIESHTASLDSTLSIFYLHLDLNPSRVSGGVGVRLLLWIWVPGLSPSILSISISIFLC